MFKNNKVDGVLNIHYIAVFLSPSFLLPCVVFAIFLIPPMRLICVKVTRKCRKLTLDDGRKESLPGNNHKSVEYL